MQITFLISNIFIEQRLEINALTIKLYAFDINTFVLQLNNIFSLMNIIMDGSNKFDLQFILDHQSQIMYKQIDNICYCKGNIVIGSKIKNLFLNQKITQHDIIK